jgi:general secretion pathway protein B
MSFILDALKKSENERQRQVGPSLADVPTGKRRNDKPWWAVAVAALLVVNLGVLMVVLTRDGDAKPTAPQPAESSTAQAATSAPQPAAQVRTRQYAGTQIPEPAYEEPSLPPTRSAPPSPAVRSLADEAGTTAYDSGDPNMPHPNLAAAAAVPAGPPMVRPIEAPTVAPAPARPASRSVQGTAGTDNEVLPTLTDVAASGTTLPELHLDIHVNSANAAERFVFVNMRKYTEGQTLSEGPMVEKINAEGVVLNHHGLRFLLPRQ